MDKKEVIKMLKDTMNVIEAQEECISYTCLIFHNRENKNSVDIHTFIEEKDELS